MVVRTESKGGVQRRGILDRAENEGKNRGRNEDEELEAALAESLALSLSVCCSYSNGSFLTGDDLQLDQAGNCRAMEDLTGEENNPHQNTGKNFRKK